MTTKRRLSAALVTAAGLAILCAAVAVAGGPPNKSGGTAPVKLTLLNSDTDFSGLPAVQWFIDRVGRLSKGSVTIDVRLQNDGHAGFEQRVVRDVIANKAQLAWVGTRVWDTLGVSTFRALHAPMLVDSYALEGAVLTSDLPKKMLAGLSGHGVVGLALLGDNLRYPAAVSRRLSGPAAFKGLPIRSMTSSTQAAAFRALGARPSGQGWAELDGDLRSGRLGALEVDLNTYETNAYAGITPYVTVNLALWPRTTVLFANEDALAKLSAEQRGWIRQAAADAARYSLTTFAEDQRIIRSECRNGMKAVVASPTELGALRNAFAPVYAALRQDAATAQIIAAISALKQSVAASPLAVPNGCIAAARTTASAGSETTFPEGVYRTRRTRADILQSWPNAPESVVRAQTATLTWTFKGGAFSHVLTNGGAPRCRRADGTYVPKGVFLTAVVTDLHGCPGVEVPRRLKVRWWYDGKALRFHVAQPVPPWERTIWEASSFVRIR
jgi:TRAP-type C4-dicarboxylate transport system substrate-binding protein